MVLLGLTVLRYVQALRTWMREMKSPAFVNLSEKQRARYIQAPEYLALREAARKPLRLSMILFALLFVAMRLPF